MPGHWSAHASSWGCVLLPCMSPTGDTFPDAADLLRTALNCRGSCLTSQDTRAAQLAAQLDDLVRGGLEGGSRPALKGTAWAQRPSMSCVNSTGPLLS